MFLPIHPLRPTRFVFAVHKLCEEASNEFPLPKQDPVCRCQGTAMQKARFRASNAKSGLLHERNIRTLRITVDL
jgi:hypothetical protein